MPVHPRDNESLYFDEITILRAFAIMGVISAHVSGSFVFMNTGNFLAVIYMAINAFTAFAVPLFICISGFVLFNKYPDTIDLTLFYKKRLTVLIPPYLFFSTIGLILEFQRGLNYDLPAIIIKYLTSGWISSYWFVVLIIQIYLIYPVLQKIYTWCKSHKKIPDLLVITFLAGVVYNGYIVPCVFNQIVTDPSGIGVTTRFIAYLFYFILGMSVRDRYLQLYPRCSAGWRSGYYFIPLLVGTIIGTITISQVSLYSKPDLIQILPVPLSVWNWIVAFIMPLYYIVIFSICFLISTAFVSQKKSVFTLLDTIGHYSFGIFLVHLFMLSEIIRTMNRAGYGWDNYLFYPIAFTLTLISSLLIVAAIQKIPGGRLITGGTR